MDRESDRVSTSQSLRVSDHHYRDERKTTGRDTRARDYSDESNNARHRHEWTVCPCLARDVRRRVARDYLRSALRDTGPFPKVARRVAAISEPSPRSQTFARCDVARTDR